VEVGARVIVARRRAAERTPFDRQRLVRGWDQARVEAGRVLVAGVGALGNSVAAELVGHGVRQLVLVDNDVVETTNLSRTPLFRPGDEGRRKSDVAAARLAARAPAGPLRLTAIHADAVWELGWGVYRRVDVVLGCVDSAAARAGVGATAWALDVPAVFGGIYAWDGNVLVQGREDGPCVACDFGAAELADMNRHYSCHRVRREDDAAPALPTLGLTASVVGALMARETLRLLHGDLTRSGFRTYFDGGAPSLHRLELRRAARCPLHVRVADVLEVPDLSSALTAGAALELLGRRLGKDVVLDLGRDFLVDARCLGCGALLALGRPRHRTRERDLICERCSQDPRPLVTDPEISAIHQVSSRSGAALLDLPLGALGVPPLHVLQARTTNGSRWVELTADAARVLSEVP
jgi:adenylyltransferase/sulfurtransferase